MIIQKKNMTIQKNILNNNLKKILNDNQIIFSTITKKKYS